jgi:hypothetical protein
LLDNINEPLIVQVCESINNVRMVRSDVPHLADVLFQIDQKQLVLRG